MFWKKKKIIEKKKPVDRKFEIHLKDETIIEIVANYTYVTHAGVSFNLGFPQLEFHITVCYVPLNRLKYYVETHSMRIKKW